MDSNPLETFIEKNSERACKWREEIEYMLGCHHSYGYAEDTLLAILDYIDANNSITDGQITALENIKNKPSQHGFR